MAVARFDDWQLAFGQVRHTRLRPKRNAFHYPAFYLRVPIHRFASQAAPQAPGGTRWFGVNRSGLLSFFEADHGNGQGCRAWVEGLLRAQGLPTDGSIWLLTFPRVLGYVFKPVSFWLCHAADGALMAVVAEVNNTFGERHTYLVCDHKHEPIRFGQALHSHKNFHVSPFCEVTGRYQFRFFDSADRSLARVDHEDHDGPLLLTSMSGSHEPLSFATVRRALLRYPLFTFGVMARIHWQALRLWTKGVRFVSKPTPPAHPVTTALQ